MRRKFSDEKKTRANGGALINPKTQDTRFELTKWILHYGEVSNLKDSDVSQPIIDSDEQGRKSYNYCYKQN
jgi:peptidyl-prolyl cis-trans isomerase SurA